MPEADSHPTHSDRIFDGLDDRILLASAVLREVREPTPVDAVAVSGGGTLLLKREDGLPIHAYKWRGAYFKISRLRPEERERGIVAASAGNHAQGVALAARRQGIKARLYMPQSTPVMKQRAVAELGGDAVEVVLHGDHFDEASSAANACARDEGMVLVHPYDDIDVIAGQGTIGYEVATSGCGPIDVAFLQIGGGGMAAGVACWLRRAYPGIHIVGVEGEDQASMQQAVRSGGPSALDYVDVFCDGTAVKTVGDLTFPLCRDLIDSFVSVSNEQVCAAIRFLWEQRRTATEPAGALGVAAWRAAGELVQGKRSLAVLCGANMDFAQFSYIARHADRGEGIVRRFFRFSIEEKDGTLLELLRPIRSRANIIEFQYGKVDRTVANPVIGIEADTRIFAELEDEWGQAKTAFSDVTGDEDTEFRIIPFDSRLFKNPLFVRVEFPERAGALSDFLKGVSEFAGICYFNYTFSGERVGRALLGFEFTDGAGRERFREAVSAPGTGLRSVAELDPPVVDRICRTDLAPE